MLINSIRRHRGQRIWHCTCHYMVSSVVSAAAIAIVLQATCYAASGQFAFTTVVDTNDLVPGSESPFFRFGDVMIDGADIVFSGWNESQNASGFYHFREGEFAPVLDHRTTLRDSMFLRRSGAYGGAGVGRGALAFKIHTDNYAVPRNAREELYYADLDTGSLNRIYVTSGGTTVDAPAVYADRVVFRVFDSWLNRTSLQLWTLGRSQVIVSRGDTAPGGLGVFAAIGTIPEINDTVIAFDASTQLDGNPLKSGTFAYRDGEFQVIVTEGTVVPGLESPVESAFLVGVDKGNVFVSARLESGLRAHLLHDGVALRAVSSPDEPILGYPGQTIGTLNLVLRDYEDGQRFFSGAGSLFLDVNGELVRVIGPGDALDGKIVQSAIATYGRSLDSGRTLIHVEFANGDRAIMLATAIPEPSTIVLAITGLAAIVGLRRHWIRSAVKP